jgi:type VI protein secretion system component VasK
MRQRSFFHLIARRWRAERERRPYMAAILTLLTLNLGFLVWSYTDASTLAEEAPQELNASAIVLQSQEEGLRHEAQALAQAQALAAARAKPAVLPDMLVEYESAPAKEIPPER